MATPVAYRQLGKCGLRVSVPILGCMGFGSDKWFPWVLPEEQALPVMKAAWDAGINTFDTANMYSNGLSENMIAKFLRKYSIPRKDVIIMDKIFYITSDDDPSFIPSRAQAGRQQDVANTREYVNKGGLSRVAIRSQVTKCLSCLETDYIDILQVHFWDPNTPPEETMSALNDVIVSGKALYLGASNFKAWQLAEMNTIAERHGWAQFVSIQVEHSLLYRAEELETLAYCLYKGIGVLAFAPLMDGHLARPLGATTSRTKTLEGTRFAKKLRASDEEIVRRVQQVAEKRGWTMAQVALSWSASKVTAPIIGANSPERVNGNLFTGLSLSEEEVKLLEEPYEQRGHRR